MALLLAAAVLGLLLSMSGPRRAPELRLQTIDGHLLSMRALRGHPVLISFWSPSCAPCLREMPALSGLYDELFPAGLRMVAIATAYDPPYLVLSTARRLSLPFPVAVDPEGAAARALGGVTVTPTSLLLDPDGQIVSRTAGPLDMVAVRQTLRQFLRRQVR